MTCPQCGVKNASNVRHCTRCGGSLVGEARFNRGCFIPMLLILATLLMSVVVFQLARQLDEPGVLLPMPAPGTPPATRPTTAPR
jgi:predicted nucleic acid-binding Zn ribbon protein